MFSNYKKHLFVFCCACLISITPSHAQNENSAVSAEDVAIAFYKTGNITPNFKKWIEESEIYKSTVLGRRDKVLKEEDFRLKSAYQGFNPEKDFLTIKTSAFIQPIKKLDKQGKASHSVQILIDKNKEVSYFPYKFLNQHIMVIPHDMDKLIEQDITENEFNHIESITKKDVRFPLILKLKPKDADFSHPYIVDETPQWAFLTQVASMESWSKKGTLIWEYSAPWYLSPQEQQINDLYKPADNISSDFGYIKPVGVIK